MTQFHVSFPINQLLYNIIYNIEIIAYFLVCFLHQKENNRIEDELYGRLCTGKSNLVFNVGRGKTKLLFARRQYFSPFWTDEMTAMCSLLANFLLFFVIFFPFFFSCYFFS